MDRVHRALKVVGQSRRGIHGCKFYIPAFVPRLFPRTSSGTDDRLFTSLVFLCVVSRGFSGEYIAKHGNDGGIRNQRKSQFLYIDLFIIIPIAVTSTSYPLLA